MKKEIIIIMLLLLCTPPVAAVMYSEEYYMLQDRSNDIMKDILKTGTVGIANYEAQVIQIYELRRQTILLEKQNELQAELVKAQWVETCYRPLYTGMGNYSAWKSECANAGYPVG